MHAAISRLNWSEVLQKALRHGVAIKGLYEDLQALGLTIISFDVEDAERTAWLWSPGTGLSLVDRDCLALGIRLGSAGVDG